MGKSKKVGTLKRRNMSAFDQEKIIESSEIIVINAPLVNQSDAHNNNHELVMNKNKELFKSMYR